MPSLSETTAWLDDIRGLPVPEARRRAELLLADNSLFVCVAASGPVAVLTQLGPETSRLFTAYVRIENATTFANLDRDQIAPSPINSRYLRIGTTLDDADVVVLPNEDTVYELDAMQTEVQARDAFPTIYHWIVAEGEGQAR